MSSRVPNSSSCSEAGDVAAGDLHSARRLAVQGRANAAGRDHLRHRIHLHHLLEDRRAAPARLRACDPPRRRRARHAGARLRPGALESHEREGRPTLGIPLRRGSGRIARAAGHVVLPHPRAHLRSVCRPGELLDDDRLRDRHLRAQLRQRPLRGGADLLRLGADDRGAAALRQSLPLDFRRAARPLVLRHEIHRRAAAPHAARCGDRLARHDLAGDAFRHRAQQHAARPVHVRRRAPHRRLESEAQSAARIGAGFRAERLQHAPAGGKRRRRRPAIATPARRA